MKFSALLLTCLLCTSVFAQDLTGPELLEKAIDFHDPKGNWPDFNGEFTVVMSSPNSASRVSHIKINLGADYFKIKAAKGDNTTQYKVEGDSCEILLNDKQDISEAELIEHNLSCARAKKYKDYYTYLYGLPMKLKDPGTKIQESIDKRSFMGKEYLVLKVTYDINVGNDIWYFYFDPKTYAMEIYQFYKTDKSGSINKESGEYILLSDIEIVSDIKMPKVRKWYYNKDDKFLGTDTLN